MSSQPFPASWIILHHLGETAAAPEALHTHNTTRLSTDALCNCIYVSLPPSSTHQTQLHQGSDTPNTPSRHQIHLHQTSASTTLLLVQPLFVSPPRPQREFEKWKVKKKKLSLFMRSAKWKKICFHSFLRSEKWNQNASRPRSRSENSREFLTILEKRDFTTELFDKEEEVVDFQDDFTHLALASTTRGGLTTWRRTSTRLSTRTLMTWRANLRSSRSSFLCWYPRQ